MGSECLTRHIDVLPFHSTVYLVAVSNRPVYVPLPVTPEYRPVPRTIDHSPWNVLSGRPFTTVVAVVPVNRLTTVLRPSVNVA